MITNNGKHNQGNYSNVPAALLDPSSVRADQLLELGN